MKYNFGWALPDQDTHFGEYLAMSEEAFGRRICQGSHVKAVLGATRSKRVALDIGAHVGFWSYYLAKYFAEVHAFEPVPSSIEWGYEKFVLEGARKTLLRNKPVIIIEQKRSSGRYSINQFGALKYLESIGARVIHQVVDDFILGWPRKPD